MVRTLRERLREKNMPTWDAITPIPDRVPDWDIVALRDENSHLWCAMGKHLVASTDEFVKGKERTTACKTCYNEWYRQYRADRKTNGKRSSLAR